MACPRTVGTAATATAKALALYLDVSGADIQTQTAKYVKYNKARDCLLTVMKTQILSDEQEASLVREAQRYRKVMRGAGCSY